MYDAMWPTYSSIETMTTNKLLWWCKQGSTNSIGNYTIWGELMKNRTRFWRSNSIMNYFTKHMCDYLLILRAPFLKCDKSQHFSLVLYLILLTKSNWFTFRMMLRYQHITTSRPSAKLNKFPSKPGMVGMESL